MAVIPTGPLGQQTKDHSLSTTRPSDDTLPAGTNILGKVTTDQTTHGTTDLVAADLTKVGGSTLTIGQQLAAASLPVILPAATVTAPPRRPGPPAS